MSSVLGVLKTLERGEELIHVPVRKEAFSAEIDHQIERVSTEHDEMQWRLIRLGHLAKCDVWVPRNDQTKQFDGHHFRDFVLRDFSPAERKELPEIVGRAAESARILVERGLAVAQNEMH